MKRPGFEQFLAEIAPFFHGRQLTYVDVGAYTGQVFQQVLRSELAIAEAHLIEPNAAALRAAQQRTAAAFRGRSVDYYRLAIGARPGKLRLHAAKSMTRVVGGDFAELGDTDDGGPSFEVDCTTLDELSTRFTDRRVSLLKIDVEGYEAEVLAGARDLLREQRVDVLYIEAGMSPDGTQQCHYRRIEDAVAEHGYRLFGIYEQTHEWLRDSPTLRRVNMAFISEKFALSNPYRLTCELYEARREVAAARRELAAAESARAADARLLEQHRQALRQREQAQQALEDALREVLACLAQLQRLEARARSELTAARAETARLKSSFRYRLGARLVEHGRSPWGWLTAPAALAREYAEHRRRMAQLATTATAPPPRVIEMPSGSDHVFIELGREPQVLDVARTDADSVELWATALPASRDRVTLTMKVLRAGEPSKQARLHRRVLTRDVLLEPYTPAALLPSSGKHLRVEISCAHGGPHIIKLELRTTPPSNAARDGAAPPARLDRSPAPSAAVGQHAHAALTAKAFTAGELDKKLWGGFADHAIPALEALKADRGAPLSERELAAWSLAGWFFVEEDYARALENVELGMLLTEKPRPRLSLARAQCLIRLHRYREAAIAIDEGEALKQLDFQLLRSTLLRRSGRAKGDPLERVEAAQLQALNEAYLAAGLAPLRKRDETRPLAIDNIVADAAPAKGPESAKVSVIVPAYNAAESIEWVVDSLLRQTWRNLEIIVVDDCSGDGTADIVEGLCARDSRVRLVRRARNGGAYAARNTGLEHATGDLITVHDSDDWSHPQRIELQVQALERSPAAVASKSHWVRVNEALEIVGPWRPKGTLMDLNFASLLFPRELSTALGPWDEVRVSGDAEFYSRLKHAYGEEAIVKLPPQKPLALSLARSDSLTRQNGATHVRTIHHGLRCAYRGAYLDWHARSKGRIEALRLDPSAARPFALPPGNRPGRRDALRYDVVFVSDFAMRGGAFVSTLHYVLAARKAGKRVGILHWRRFDLAADANLQPRLYEACAEHDVDILTPGDRVETTLVIVGYPPILQQRLHPLPDIAAGHVAVIVNQFASRLIGGQDQQYDPLIARATLKSLFGDEGTWLPISAWVKRLMEEDDRYPQPFAEPWHPLIDTDSWCAEPLRWRGLERSAPVIGRHGRDAYTKWPADRVALAQAYGVNQRFDVRFLGGADHAVTMLGDLPANWTVLPFDGLTAREFLQDLDFYVHYPHEHYIEEFGRGVMEAMALGIPVILPPQFEETFGDAAVYAAPDDVARTVMELWSSEAKYLERAAAGRAFVLRNCRMSAFGARLDALLAAARGTSAEERTARMGPLRDLGH